MAIINPIAKARAVYDREACARSFEEDLEAHLLHGWVISTPDMFIMGRPVLKTAPAHILDPWWPFGDEADCWHVWLAAGDLRAMWAHLPFPLPWISFERDNALRFYKFESLRKKIVSPTEGRGLKPQED